MMIPTLPTIATAISKLRQSIYVGSDIFIIPHLLWRVKWKSQQR